MSIAESCTIEPLSARATNSDAGEIAVSCRWQVCFACVVLALGCNYVLGKDMAWDTLNYHFYLGFSALNNRFNQDYFAAGTLSYLNPYAYAPFYAMVRAGLPALVICSVFAAVHSIILWLSFELGLAVCPSADGRTRIFAGCCAAALAFMNPILMQQIGSCFADITTAELALGGWLLLAGAVRLPRKSLVVYGGLMLGAASALKLSNALSALSAFAMFGFLPLNWRDRIRHGLLCGISVGIGFAVVTAPWSYQLEKAFGNPMFPMFNGIFRSPEFTTEPMGIAYRFVPDSIGEAFWRPFAMVAPVRMVHEELSAPDPRYAILATLTLLLVLRWAWGRISETLSAPDKRQSNDSLRVLAALACALGLNWTIWLLVSGNSRYALPMACIAAAVLVGMLFRFFSAQPKVRNYVLAIVFVTQAVQLYMGAEYRWNGVSWGGVWFDVSIPADLGTKPNLYLTIGTQSNSFLAPFLPEGSGLVNIAGGYTLDPEGANGEHVRALIRRFSPNVRIAFVTTKPADGVESPKAPPLVDSALQWYGLRVDLSHCATLVVHGLPPALEIRFQTSLPQAPQNRDTTFLASCSVVADATDLSTVIARRRTVDAILNHLEDACPRLFQPRRLVTEHDGDLWRRVYPGTDISAWVSHGRVKFSDQIRPNGLIDVGSERDWVDASPRLDCGRVSGVYFAHVANQPASVNFSGRETQ